MRTVRPGILLQHILGKIYYSFVFPFLMLIYSLSISLSPCSFRHFLIKSLIGPVCDRVSFLWFGESRSWIWQLCVSCLRRSPTNQIWQITWVQRNSENVLESITDHMWSVSKGRVYDWHWLRALRHWPVCAIRGHTSSQHHVRYTLTFPIEYQT